MELKIPRTQNTIINFDILFSFAIFNVLLQGDMVDDR